jgi:hypothetical protein
MNDRDTELGAALRELPVPDHEPDFFTNLEARLATTAPTPTPLRRRPLLYLTTAAAVIVAVLVGSALLPVTNRVGPGPHVAAAAEVRAKVATAFATATSLRGEITVDDRGNRQQSTFVTAADGSERVTALGAVDDLAYDAPRGVQRVVHHEGNPAAEEITGLPPGPPDFAASPSVLQRQLASMVRVFLAGNEAVPVREVTAAGRPAWRLIVPVTPNKLAGPNASGDELDVTVDRATGFPVRVVESLQGSPLVSVELNHLVVNAPIPPGTFTLAFPPGVRVFRQDVGFRPSANPDHLPLPATLPSGYRKAEVVGAPRSQPTGNEGMNPPSRDVLSVAYRRGFDRIVVSVRAVGADASAWSDPLGTGEGFIDTPEPVTITDGALRGGRAELLVNPRGIPHVWVVTNRFVVTVAGDATRAELLEIVNSFA